MSKPIKILDANTIIEYYGEISGADGNLNLSFGNTKMTELAQQLDPAISLKR